MKRHQRNGIITAALLALAVVALCSSGCGSTVTPLCRHIVLAHHAAAVDAGFEAEKWRIKNPKPVDGFKFSYFAHHYWPFIRCHHHISKCCAIYHVDKQPDFLGSVLIRVRYRSRDFHYLSPLPGLAARLGGWLVGRLGVFDSVQFEPLFPYAAFALMCK